MGGHPRPRAGVAFFWPLDYPCGEMEAELAARAIQRLRSGHLFGCRVVYLPQVGSTQDVARQEAVAGAPEGTVVLADEQTAGRGRFGRSWVSPPGRSVHLTLVLRPDAARLRTLGIIAPVAVARAVEALADLRPAIKWPNDVVVNQRKLAGVLIESEAVGNQVAFALLGIGVNVNLEVAAHPEIAGLATSLLSELGREVSRELLLLLLLQELEELYLATPPGAAAYQEWRRRLVTLGREVRVSFGDRVEEGLAEDTDANGDLILRRPDGSRLAVSAGDVTLRT